jgi:hypothetical protein
MVFRVCQAIASSYTLRFSRGDGAHRLERAMHGIAPTEVSRTPFRARFRISFLSLSLIAITGGSHADFDIIRTPCRG